MLLFAMQNMEGTRLSHASPIWRACSSPVRQRWPNWSMTSCWWLSTWRSYKGRLEVTPGVVALVTHLPTHEHMWSVDRTWLWSMVLSFCDVTILHHDSINIPVCCEQLSSPYLWLDNHCCKPFEPLHNTLYMSWNGLVCRFGEYDMLGNYLATKVKDISKT